MNSPSASHPTMINSSNNIMSSSLPSFARTALLAAASLACAALAQAQLAFQVKVDTSGLTYDPANPFYLDFQLNDGAGWGNANNHAVISNFNFGSGMALDPASTFGGASGDLGSWVALTDSSAFNEFFQPFAPGDWLSFTVSLTTNLEADSVPDVFAFTILDGNLFNLATTAPGTDLFLDVNIDQANPAISVYSSLDGAVAAPLVQAVPEPSTYGLLGAAGLILICAVRRRSRSQV